jgi:hypothetical protein
MYGNNAYGSQDSNTLVVKGVPGGGDFSRETFLKFDLSSTRQLVSAVLILAKTSNTFECDVAVVSDDNWNENTITDTNKPVSGSIVGRVGSDGIAVLDMQILSTIVTGNKIVSIKLYDSQLTDVTMSINSKEAGSAIAPRLRIVDTAVSDSSTSSPASTSSSSDSTSSSPDSSASGASEPISDNKEIINDAIPFVKFSWSLMFCGASILLLL